MEYFNGLENPRFEQEKEITYEQRDEMEFFWTFGGWAFYDKKTNKIYNEYCRLISDDAYNHLLKNGLIDVDGNKIKTGINDN